MKLSLSSVVLTMCWLGIAAGVQGKEMEQKKGNAVNVICETTKGRVDIVVQPDWAPRGAARFLQLVDDGHFHDLPFFRCVDNFLCQFGSMPPRAGAKSYATIPDDPKLPQLRAFHRGYLSFAGNGENSRATHMFITLGEKLDGLGAMPWETPFGFVTDASMQSTVSHFTTSYGDIAPWGAGPDPQKIEAPDGAAYLKKNFPALDYIKSCKRG